MPTRHKISIVTLAAVCAFITIGPSAHAQLVITTQNVTASPGGTGSFDVVLKDVTGTNQVGAFSFGLSILPASGITFTAAGTTTVTASYIFGTLQSPPFSFSTFPTTSFTASDADFASPFFVTLSPGQTVGLGRINFAVAAGAPLGPDTVSFVPAATGLSNASGANVPASLVPGTITVLVAPEPSSVAALGIGLLGLAGSALRARRRSS